MKNTEIKYIFLILFYSFIQPVRTQEKSYVVERYNDDTVTQQPTKGDNLFRNDNPLCFFSYCWNKGAKCGSGFSCCWCKCKDRGTFVSKKHGCMGASQITSVTSNQGEQCYFYTKSMGYSGSYVPLFTEHEKIGETELVLEDDFELNENVTCSAGVISYFTYRNGSKQMIYNNKCDGELLKVRVDSSNGKLQLRWGPRTGEEWARMGGHLLSVDIHCQTITFDDFYSSCLIFQVAGESGKELLTAEPSVPSNFTCPTYEPFTTVTTTKNTTQSPNTIGKKDETTDNNNIGVVVSVVVVIVLVIIIVIVVIFFMRKRKKSQAKLNENQDSNLTSGHQPLVVKTNTYEDIKVSRDTNQPNHLKKGFKDDQDLLYVDIPDAEYTSIDENEYETPVNLNFDSGTLDMSKRPLPERPQNINNPYYEMHALANNDKESDNRDLYSLYSSIENLKPK